MALREFTDSQGREWRAWDVPPHRVHADARSGAERRVRVTDGYAPERRSGVERRRKTRLAHERGWVCFESADEKRRLIPPPPDWAEAGDGELEALCREAAPGPRRS